MRTDVKIGIAIGVFVLAIVAVLVAYQKSHNAGDNNVAQQNKDDTPKNMIEGGSPKPAPKPVTTPTPSPSPTPTATPSPSPSPMPSPGPGPSPTPGSTPTPSPVPTIVPTPTPTPTPTPAAGGDKTYTVQAGDTGFYSIAARPEVYGNAKLWEVIAKANPNIKSNQLRQGMTLVIPKKPDTPERPPLAATGPAGDDKNSYVVKQGDTMWKIAETVYKNGKHFDLIQKANPSVKVLQPGMRLTIPPNPDDATRTATAPAASGVPYTAKAGDTLQNIAQSQYGDLKYWSLIKQANPSIPADGSVRPGMLLTLPPAKNYVAPAPTPPAAVIRVNINPTSHPSSAPATSRPRPTPSPTPKAARPADDDGKPVFD